MRKFIILACLACVAFADKNLDTLLERANALEAEAHKAINELKDRSKSHLVGGIENELREVEKLEERLKKLASEKLNVIEEHELKQLEDELARAEEHLKEEVSVAEGVEKDHKFTGKDVKELLDYAEKLDAEVKKILAKHEGANKQEIDLLISEEKNLEKLSKELRKHPVGQIADKEEEELERLERSLRALVQRIENEH